MNNFKVGDKVMLNGYRKNAHKHLHGTTKAMEEWEKTKQQLTVTGVGRGFGNSFEVSDRGCQFILHESEISPWETHWDGEGLPPVGTVCEISTAYGWLKCDIIFENGDYAIGHIHEGQDIFLRCDWSRTGFRKILSARERVVKSLSREILESVNKKGEAFRHKEWEVAEHLYQAIANGNVEGVKLKEEE